MLNLSFRPLPRISVSLSTTSSGLVTSPLMLYLDPGHFFTAWTVSFSLAVLRRTWQPLLCYHWSWFGVNCVVQVNTDLTAFFQRKSRLCLFFKPPFFFIRVASTLLYTDSSLLAGNREVTSNLSPYLEIVCSSPCYYKDKNMHVFSKVFLRILSDHNILYSFSLLETDILFSQDDKSFTLYFIWDCSATLTFLPLLDVDGLYF